MCSDEYKIEFNLVMDVIEDEPDYYTKFMLAREMYYRMGSRMSGQRRWVKWFIANQPWILWLAEEK